MKKVLYIWLVLTNLLIMDLRGQSSPTFSQYSFNNFLINPACAGSEGYTSLNMTARESWLRMANAPQTYALSYQQRWLTNKSAASPKRRYNTGNKGRVGVGANIYSDRLANYNQTGFAATYAYHISIQKTQISMGLSLGGYQYMLDKTQVTLPEKPSDALLDNTNMKAYVPDATLGLSAMYMGGYGGLSVTDLIGGSIKFGDVNNVSFKKYRTYNIIGYYLFDFENNFAIEPGMWLKVEEKTRAVNYVITTKVFYSEDYWLGMSYRTTDRAIIFMAGVRYDRYFFGYAYDYSINPLIRTTYGSHEFMVAAKFGENVRRYRWVSRY